MTILTTADLATYAPAIPAADRAQVMIVLAEALAFGPNGSGRRLDRHVVKEVRRLSTSSQVIPNHPIDLTQAITVEWRDPQINNNWITIEPAWLVIEDNRITVKSQAPIVTQVLSVYGRWPGHDTRRRPNARTKPELRLEYSTGIDFTATSDESEMIKAALGGIMTLQYAAARGLNQITTSVNAIAAGSNAGRVLLEKSVDGEASLRYDSPNNAAQASRSLLGLGSANGEAGGQMADLLAIFKAYRFSLPTS